MEYLCQIMEQKVTKNIFRKTISSCPTDNKGDIVAFLQLSWLHDIMILMVIRIFIKKYLVQYSEIGV